MAPARKTRKKKLTLQDLTKVDMDPILKAQIKQPTGGKGVLTGEDLTAIRIFARMTLQVAKQRNSDLTEEQLVKNLITTLKKVKPSMRAIMLEQMKVYTSEQ